MKIDTLYVHSIKGKENPDTLIQVELHTDKSLVLEVFIRPSALLYFVEEKCEVIFKKREDFMWIDKAIGKSSNIQKTQLEEYYKKGKIRIEN